ncbi:MAG: L-threonylcarbamoyladenylate synthase [Gammaproteobacteria bacterium]|nr:L-threonylcarbamoyladenylate synthase [Gammaproteobacteria bacterium]
MAGGVVLYPTEGVYGLGALPNRPDAISRIIDIKQRDAAKGIILIAAHLAQLEDYIDTDALASHLTARWPQAITYVVPAKAETSPLLTGGRDSIAVRVTAHPTARALCIASRSALLSTSANVSGHPAAAAEANIDPYLFSKVDAFCEGKLGGLNKPSAIFDTLNNRWIRK